MIQIDPEFQNLIPPLSDDERRELETSILQYGCQAPLTVWEETGQLLDGHNRYAICTAHGVHYDVRHLSFADREAAIEWIIRNQIGRRNLTSYARMELAHRLKALLAARAHEKKRNQVLEANLPQAPHGRGPQTRDQLAALAGVSGRTYQSFETVHQHAPAPVREATRRGDLSISRAEKLTRALNASKGAVRDACLRWQVTDPQLVQLLNEKASTETVNEVLASGRIQYEGGDDPRDRDLCEASAWDLQGLLRHREREHRRQNAAVRQADKMSAIEQAPPNTYSIIYADPPWQYANAGLRGGAADHYPTMHTDDICTLLERINVQIAESAVLFLWATNPLLRDALRVCEQWGFEYKTNLVWDKVKPISGIGFYVRGQHELLLIAVRGGYWEPINRPVSLLREQKTEHSRKPQGIYALIEGMYPDQRYLELFARQPRQRENWAFWGNESEVEHV